MTKKTYKVIGMNCTSCAMLIESDLGDIGIKASCHYARETLDVEFDEGKISEDKLKEVVKASGYGLS
ncbi:hypothetical protein A2971_03180 [Candidatus Gottesmanbacteria bacterium RIFCSPLOWO2_01_FULL_46_21]|uniref:Copper ion binding protein n=2 Tax=Candidatus Gottesmaniibacteriota TaxID=1752720 RepID=A0A0G1TGB2_9BACT|nr:MAG: Copper ion binding protein [Candidatus Gottesmanbacteria bacterium GW2011_GWA1_47_8]OGG28671.1 MAG: hypothetical protein A2971_03180 [Candidatus Gottesmanbacteria bacterium RIFCSPLOWO2_01_FULL_46_21]